jgi:hypothetical protein
MSGQSSEPCTPGSDHRGPNRESRTISALGFEMDPDLRTMARDRIEGHLLENQITLEFKEGLGAGADVAATLAGRGMTVGGPTKVFTIRFGSSRQSTGRSGQAKEPTPLSRVRRRACHGCHRVPRPRPLTRRDLEDPQEGQARRGRQVRVLRRPDGRRQRGAPRDPTGFERNHQGLFVRPEEGSQNRAGTPRFTSFSP